MLRQGLTALIAPYSDMEVIGEAANGKEAVEKAQQLSPDVILMDLAMPGMDGVEATHRIIKESPGTRILILTQYEDREHVLPLIKSGASGYLPKRVAALELISAIRAVYQGDYFLHPSATKTLVEDYQQMAKSTVESDAYERLTPREKEVLRLIAEGKSSHNIADLLGLSLKTVLRHRANLMKKLEVRSYAELVKYAIRRGVVSLQG